MSETFAAWLRRALNWSNSRESWEERLAALMVLAGAVALFWYGSELPRSGQVVLWGSVAVALAVVLRRGWLKLFGPVLFYDLMRIARRRRYVILRCVYALFLFLMLFSAYRSFQSRGGAVSAAEMPNLAGSFFSTFMMVQFVTVLLLTPAFAAGAIAEEKDRKTLEFLLATDLRNREIVLSKLASRFSNLGLLILTGLPILSITQFMGGVDPDLVLAGFAATGLTMASLTALSILQSVYAKKPRDAIILTYLAAVAYLGISTFALALQISGTVWSYAVDLPFGLGSFTVGNVVEKLNVGNIFYCYGKLSQALMNRQSLADALPGILGSYALFHGLVTVICSVWAVLRLRAVAIKQTYGKKQKAPLNLRWGARPPIGRLPMIWKEVFAEGGLRLNWFGRIVVLLLVIASFVPGVWILIYYLEEWFADTRGFGRGQFIMRWGTASNSFQAFLEELGEAMNIWVRIAGTVVACLLLLAVAVRASTTVTGERDRQTWDSLLTTTLGSADILFGKWLGSILAVRWGWVWLGLIWALGLVTTGLHFIALPLLVVAWFVYAAFLATIGLWYSTTCQTSLRATVWTLMTAITAYGGHWFLWSCCIPIFMAGGGPNAQNLEWIPQFQAFALTPPAALGWLAFQGDEFKSNASGPNYPMNFTFYALFGLVLWGGATVALWAATNTRFRALTGRMPLLRRPSPRPIRGRLKPLEVLDVVPADPEPGEQDLDEKSTSQ
jgi:ABC-type transport system involved in multi-copper enzyme maturation permease subunit